MADTNDGAVHGSLRLRGEDIPTITMQLPVSKLQFYADNPRIYSLIRQEEDAPSQQEIFKKLFELDHVRALVKDIEANGGLIDPVIVRGGDFVVLEGNSRLAAYRHLAKDARWGLIKCTILPSDIDERLVYALLAQYHVKGKKDWAPYEKAGFIFRRRHQPNVDLQMVAHEMAVTREEAKHLIGVYQFMIDHQDTDREHWSYYDEFFKSRKIKKAREDHAGLDEFVVEEVKAGRIGKAADLRDKLPLICQSPRSLKRYLEGKCDFDEAHEHAVELGGDSESLQKLVRFRRWLVDTDTETGMVRAPKSVRDKLHYELKEIGKKAKKLETLLDSIKAKAQ
jgi:hypothetical protein